MNIVLIGMMGAGKTSVGESLARLTGRQLVDTDSVIEQRHGKISDIFAECGEAHFRALESVLAQKLSEQDGLIVSTGGGMLLCEKNRENLKANGVLVYLRAKAETLLSRVGEGDARPLLADAEFRAANLYRLLNERAPIYEKAADLIVDTDGKSIEETAGEILVAVEERK